jgi:hypothetical protein
MTLADGKRGKFDRKRNKEKHIGMHIGKIWGRGDDEDSKGFRGRGENIIFRGGGGY